MFWTAAAKEWLTFWYRCDGHNANWSGNKSKQFWWVTFTYSQLYFLALKMLPVISITQYDHVLSSHFSKTTQTLSHTKFHTIYLILIFMNSHDNLMSNILCKWCVMCVCVYVSFFQWILISFVILYQFCVLVKTWELNALMQKDSKSYQYIECARAKNKKILQNNRYIFVEHFADSAQFACTTMGVSIFVIIGKFFFLQKLRSVNLCLSSFFKVDLVMKIYGLRMNSLDEFYKQYCWSIFCCCCLFSIMNCFNSLEVWKAEHFQFIPLKKKYTEMFKVRNPLHENMYLTESRMPKY